jgi:hypothetical protein
MRRILSFKAPSVKDKKSLAEPNQFAKAFLMKNTEGYSKSK